MAPLTKFLGACTKQQPYIVLTELMACSLADAFHWKMFTMNRRRQVEIALDFARGMAYLHSRRQPIAHRDLKPANLMISGNLHADVEQLILDSGIVRIVDFGLSKTLMVTDKTRRQNSTQTPESKDLTDTYKLTGETGSYRYMAPEVFRHEPYNLKVDVYSFAIICFQLFEGVAPYATMDPLEAARRAACEGLRPTFPRGAQLDEVHEKLRNLVVECWDKDPDRRPTFLSIVERLEAILQMLPVHIHTFTKDRGCCSLS